MPQAWTPWGPLSLPFAARLAFPWLDRFPFSGCAALAATVAVLAAVPAKTRRTILPFAALGWIAAGSSLAFAAAFAAAACALAFVLRSRPGLGARLSAVALCGAALLAVSRTLEGFAAAAAWQLAALAAVRGVSASVDAGTDGAGARELFLYLCGGLPASFLGAYHGFSVYREAAAADRPKLSGLRDAGAGLAWLAVSAAIRAKLATAGPGRADPWAFTFSGMWAYAAVSWAAELGMWLGAYRVIEGLSRLSGYDLPDQFDRPWLSSSPLDFWRRYASQNRLYLLKYVFFPLSRLGASPAAGIAAAFAVSAALNGLRFSGLFLAAGGWPAAAAAATTFALFFAAFGAAAVAQTLLRTRGARPRRRAWAVAATAVAVVWLWAPLSYWPAPRTATPRAAAELWARVSSRLIIP